MGMSSTAFIQSVKMKKAMEMLQSDYASITAIAYSLRYNNVYEFSRSFKNYTGISRQDMPQRTFDKGAIFCIIK